MCIDECVHHSAYHELPILTGHDAELPYVFHTYEDKYTDDEKVFADTVSRYWGNFVNTGSPNTPPESSAAHCQWYSVSAYTTNMYSEYASASATTPCHIILTVAGAQL